jgi:hypothetical protein
MPAAPAPLFRVTPALPCPVVGMFLSVLCVCLSPPRQLALVVPSDNLSRFRVGQWGWLHWRELHSFVFDESCEHEVRQESSSERIVLLVDFANPLLADASTYANVALRPAASRDADADARLAWAREQRVWREHSEANEL